MWKIAPGGNKMKLDKFLLIAVGVLVIIILIILAMGGAAFLCLFVTNSHNLVNEGPMIQKAYDYNGTLAGFDRVNLNVADINGDVVVREGDSDSFAITVNTQGMENDYNRYSVDFSQSDTPGNKTLKIGISKNNNISLFNSRYSSDITITVPKGKLYEMDLNDANGNIDVGGFDCDSITASTANGRITSEANASSASYHTANGGIEARTAGQSGNIAAATANGDISIFVPQNTSVSVNAHIANGQITAAMPLETTEKSRFGLVGKTAGYSNGLYLELNTLNGNIQVNNI
jgi:hypothetical protein